MKATDVFPSNYLRAGDLNGAEPTVTIKAVELEKIGTDMKLVLYFEGKEKGVVLNKTNFSSIVDITGEEDTDDWAGHQIKLITAKVEYQGKRVPAIRIERPAKVAKQRPAPPPPPPSTGHPADAPAEDDIPF